MSLFQVYRTADRTRTTVKAKCLGDALLTAFMGVVKTSKCKVNWEEVDDFIQDSLHRRKNMVCTQNFTLRRNGKKLKGLLTLHSDPNNGVFTLSFYPDSGKKFVGVKVHTKRRVIVRDWRRLDDPVQIIKLFPKKPTSDELLALYDKVKDLRSNLLDQFLRKKSSER